MHIHFYLRYTTRFGQQLALKSEQLGLHRLTYINDEFWRASIEIPAGLKGQELRYSYVLQQKPTNVEMQGQYALQLPKNANSVTVIDVWNGMENLANTFTTQAFQKLLKPKLKPIQKSSLKKPSHHFSISAPILQDFEVPVLLGSGNALHDWSTHQPIFMEQSGDYWTASVDLTGAEFPITYKYALYNQQTNAVHRFEDGPNRTLYFGGSDHDLCLVRDGFIRLPLPNWRGAGVAIPVFSLRTKQSFGCGSFTDLKLLADWAASVGMRMIQLLPINDTAATGTFTDSYPYASISAFALNPIYADPMAIAGKKHAGLIEKIYQKYQADLAKLADVDYVVTLREKWVMLKALFGVVSKETFGSADYKDWFEAQKHWLVPYAAFCCLKVENGTTDFTKWSKLSVFDEKEVAKLGDLKSKSAQSIALHYWVQYQLHLQLKDATDYANQIGLVVKGDIPIGIYRYSADAWVAPELYNMNAQAGAPPDDFSVSGQNWGFPTYRWDRMKQDELAWWASRFNQMSLYFDAFRIDHILGFFRIWSIPLDAVQGILGQFDPAIPVQLGEFLEAGIQFDHNRFTKPYINTLIINEVFGLEAIQAVAIFMNRTAHGYELKPRYTTQRSIEAWYEESEKSKTAAFLRDGMYDIIANVLLFEAQTSYGPAYHFRYGIEQTHSFRYLDTHSQVMMRALYNDYFFKRQDAFWEREAMEKLPLLRKATNMLICGEDLGMVPACVPDVMQNLSLLSLEIQRMPKQIGQAYADPRKAPYLSVVTPSTHDMSTIRGWWEEDRANTERFFKSTFHAEASIPFYCEPWINRAVIEQHLASPAMWSIFQLQDLIGMDGALRRQNPAEERINDPSNPKHYWRYRMHMQLEDLAQASQFNTLLTDLIKGYGR